MSAGRTTLVIDDEEMVRHLAHSREQRRQSEAARRRALERWATPVDLVAAANERQRRAGGGSPG